MQWDDLGEYCLWLLRNAALGIAYVSVLCSLLVPLQPVYFRQLLALNLQVARWAGISGGVFVLACLVWALFFWGVDILSALFYPPVMSFVILIAAMVVTLFKFPAAVNPVLRPVLLCVQLAILYAILNSGGSLVPDGFFLTGAIYQGALMLLHLVREVKKDRNSVTN
jgi:hypothetical protein